MGAQADLRQGPAGRGLPGRPVLPALRHHPVRPRARPGLRGRHRPLRLRPLPADLRPAGRQGVPAGLDDHALDAGLATPPSPCTPTSTYVVATRRPTETLVVAEPLAREGARRGLDGSARPSPAADMERWTYQRPFDLVEFPDVVGGTHFVVLADYVTTEDGTGLVHQAPAFGEDDMTVCRAVRAAGGRTRSARTAPSTPTSPLVGGMFFKHADTSWSTDLQTRGLLFRRARLRAQLPALLALPHRAALLRAAVLVHPHHRDQGRAAARERGAPTGTPSTIKYGRYGDWLNNNIDWALSRSRYWGTPLPIWRCADGPPDLRRLAAPSCRELTGTDLSELDPHRPFVDEVTFACPRAARRRPAGCPRSSTPGSTPARCRSRSGATRTRRARRRRSSTAYPADFICEAIDQTRGWFYTLMAVGTLVFDESSYENVLCLGHILAEDGRKMCKHLGNILEPIPLMDKHGADAVRWFMAAGGSPWAARRVGHAHDPGDRPQGAADLLEHASPSRASTPARPAGRPAGDGPAARRRAARCWTAGCCRAPQRAGRARSPRRWRTSTPSAPARCSRRSSTTCPTGTSAARRRRFWDGDAARAAPRCTRPSTSSPG